MMRALLNPDDALARWIARHEALAMVLLVLVAGCAQGVIECLF